MSASNQWAKELQQPHATLLTILASSWEHTFAVCQLLQGKSAIQSALAKPNLRDWLKLYDSDSPPNDALFEYFRIEMGSLIDFSLIENSAKSSGPDGKDAITSLLNQLAEFGTNKLPSADEFAYPLPMAFLVLVCMPCLALYGEYPAVLMKQARDGDLDTICDLVRLDRSVIFDNTISQVIHAWALELQEVKLKRIGEAFSKGIPTISKKKVKIAWAQYVYNLAKSFGMPITAPKVRELFDALSKDAGTGPHDPDLAEMTDDAFYQAIAKRKKSLSNLLKYRQV